MYILVAFSGQKTVFFFFLFREWSCRLLYARVCVRTRNNTILYNIVRWLRAEETKFTENSIIIRITNTSDGGGGGKRLVTKEYTGRNFGTSGLPNKRSITLYLLRE